MSDPRYKPRSAPPGTPPSDSVADLRADLGAVLGVAEKLRGDVHTAERARRRATQVNVALLGLLALFVGMLVAVVYQNNSVIAKVDKGNEQLASCIDPTGDCYREGRARTDGAINAVVRISIFVSECGRLWPGESGPIYDRKLEECVMARLRAAAQANPSAPPGAPAPSGSARSSGG